MKGYSFQNNAFTKTVKDAPADRLEVEIGDSKQPDTFYPQVKIQRWSNEVNCSIRLLHNETNPKITVEGEKIIWAGKKIEAHFYDLGISKEHPEGARELEIILKEKPASNKLEFTLNTKGLDFFYQPELTKEEKDKGSFRPENVVGSYAVYASENKINYVGGKLYRVGKFGHIFRPKITDAEGKWDWEELNIENGILTITIPQEFLDKAVYPISSKGTTFGYEGAGATSFSCSADYIYRTNKAYTGVSGTGVSMTAKVKDSGDRFKLALYKASDSTLVEGTEYGVAEATASSKTVNFDSPPTIEAIDYFLVFRVNNAMVLYSDDTDSGNYKQVKSTWEDEWPSPISWSTGVFDREFSIYCTYEAAAPPAGPSIVGWKTLLGVGQG